MYYKSGLQVRLQGWAKSVAYADDLALVISAESSCELVWNTEENLGRIERWMIAHDLTLARKKTEIVVLKGATRQRVTLQQNWLFGGHIQSVCQKVSEKAGRLRRLMPNVPGPNMIKRKVMAQACESALLYAALVWWQAVEVTRNRCRLESVQKKTLLSVASAYRTVSTPALQVVTTIHNGNTV